MQIVRLRHVRRIRAGGRDYCYRQPTEERLPYWPRMLSETVQPLIGDAD